MAAGLRFDRFLLDPDDRRLLRDGAPVELNPRYFDALSLLVREQGKLISKDQFLEEVWRGVPVTDEALTQCVRTLRRQLGDDAAAPRFIQTVPKHGYRFIAPVEPADASGPVPLVQSQPAIAAAVPVAKVFRLGAAGTLGGGAAGALVGLFYGFAAASPEAAMGSASILLVLAVIGVILGLIAGAGVAFGIAAASLASGPRWAWTIGCGAAGGLATGAFGKLLGLDAFNLLFGQSPGDITGGLEGLLLGAALGLGVWLGGRGGGPLLVRRSVAAACLAAAAAGVLSSLLGGRLMGGSLDLLTRRFPDSRLRLDQIGGLFGESGFGTLSQAVTAGLEAALFGACVVGAMALTRRTLTPA